VRTEKAIFRPGIEHATPQGVADFFAEVFAALLERPRSVMVTVDFSEAEEVGPLTLDLEKGEPVFLQEDARTARTRLGRCWIAEHAVPLVLSRRLTCFLLIPADSGRIKVRLLRPGLLFWYNMWELIGRQRNEN